MPSLPLASRGFNALTQALLHVNPDLDDSERGQSKSIYPWAIPPTKLRRELGCE